MSRASVHRFVDEIERKGYLEAVTDAIAIANGACRSGEKCQNDGGCRHVPCITARMIAHELLTLREHSLATGASESALETAKKKQREVPGWMVLELMHNRHQWHSALERLRKDWDAVEVLMMNGERLLLRRPRTPAD